jgi:WD40 repeat protein
MIRALALSPNGRLLATPSYDQTVRVWQLNSNQYSVVGNQSLNTEHWSLINVTTLTAHTGYVRAAAFSPDNTLLATGGADKIIHLWRIGPPPKPPPHKGGGPPPPPPPGGGGGGGGGTQTTPPRRPPRRRCRGSRPEAHKK